MVKIPCRRNSQVNLRFLTDGKDTLIILFCRKKVSKSLLISCSFLPEKRTTNLVALKIGLIRYFSGIYPSLTFRLTAPKSPKGDFSQLLPFFVLDMNLST